MLKVTTRKKIRETHQAHVDDLTAQRGTLALDLQLVRDALREIQTILIEERQDDSSNGNRSLGSIGAVVNNTLAHFDAKIVATRPAFLSPVVEAPALSIEASLDDSVA